MAPRILKLGALASVMGFVAVSCNSSGLGPTQEPSVASASPLAVASAAGSSEPTVSPSDAAGMTVDGLAEVLVNDLNLRVKPSTTSESLGKLSFGELAYVVDGPVEADGYQWYQLASVLEPYVPPCGDPEPPPSLVCSGWFGWAAAVTPQAERWLHPITPECPAERDTDAFLALPRATRLACAGDDVWTLVVYVAQEGGRGCSPIWVTTPLWLFAACNLLFPQPVERQLDEDTRLQTFVHPDLGTCGYRTQPGCPFAALTGSWVEMTGHLDDPAASTCTAKLSDDFPDDSDPPPPPDPDQVVFACRLAFVVTAVRVTAAPSIQ